MGSRFGREDLLVEFYARELLKLVVNNATANDKRDFSVLCDKLKTQMRVLETFTVTSDRCVAMLFPLTKSCLSQELLRIWQRSGHFVMSKNDEREKTLTQKLKNLMEFLKSEVENEQRVLLVVEGRFWSCFYRQWIVWIQEAEIV